MKIVKISLLIFVSLFYLTCDGPAPVNNKIQTTITGKVIDAETKSVLQGAMISTEPPTEQTSTDDGGKFVIDLNVEVSQRYRVNAHLSDYLPNFTEITVTEGTNTTSDIALQKEKPILDVTPSVLDFGISQTSIIITIKNVGAGELNWAIKAPSESWLSLIGKPSGTITNQPQLVEVKVDRSNVTPGTYTATLAVTSNGGDCSIEVSMGVRNPDAPQLYAYPANLDFMNYLTQLTLYIRNIGTGQLDWNTGKNEPWFQLDFSSGSTKTETDEISVTANRDQLSVGNYSGKITINSNGGKAEIGVSLAVDEAPVLSVNVDEFDFGETETQKNFMISNIGGGALNWIVTANQGWIGLFPKSGSNQATINVNVDRSGLQNGDYSGQIYITSNGGYDNILVLMKKRTPNQPPTATFSVNPQTGDLETTFNVNASGSSDDYDPIDSLQVRWQWETAVGFTGWTNVKTASHKYTSYGNKTITLEVKDTGGLSADTVKTVNVTQTESDLIAFYPFNGNAKDESGKGNNGIENFVVFVEDRFGKADSACFFNGSNSNIDIGNKELVSSNFSISAWIKPSSFPSEYSTIINKLCGFIFECQPYGGWYLGIDSKSSTIRVFIFAFTPPIIVENCGTIELNKWTHIVITYDKVTLRIYQNNNKLLEEAHSNQILENGANLLIGLESDDRKSAFHGVIDDIRIFNAIINEQKIFELFHEGGWIGYN